MRNNDEKVYKTTHDKCKHLSFSQNGAQPGYETIFCSKCGKTLEEIKKEGNNGSKRN